MSESVEVPAEQSEFAWEFRAGYQAGLDGKDFSACPIKLRTKGFRGFTPLASERRRAWWLGCAAARAARKAGIVP